MRRILALALLPAFAAVAVIVTVASAGPPLICHPIEIGDAASIPWGSGPFDRGRGYGRDRVVTETLAILDGRTSVLVRMETMRRAALYLDDDAKRSAQLRSALLGRVLDAEAAGEPDALAWFDAGYLTQSFVQLGARDPHVTSDRTSDEIAGYRWVARALELRPDDGEMEFAAAMMTALANTPEHDGHVERAQRLSASNPLLARNLKHHGTKVWPHFQRH
jgi:hypothetical protein